MASRASAGTMARRLKLLLGNDVSLAAYHLPLDKHPRLGNNTASPTRSRSARARIIRRRARHRARSVGSVVAAACRRRTRSAASPAAYATARCRGSCSRTDPMSCARSACAPLPRAICSRPQRSRAVICSSPASSPRRAGDLAKELQITLVAAGHYATEVFGPDATRRRAPDAFPGDERPFVPVANPL